MTTTHGKVSIYKDFNDLQGHQISVLGALERIRTGKSKILVEQAREAKTKKGKRDGGRVQNISTPPAKHQFRHDQPKADPQDQLQKAQILRGKHRHRHGRGLDPRDAVDRWATARPD